MPAEQRVITFGFVAIGLVIAVILYVTLGGGGSVTGTLDELKGELYPRYQRAEEDRKYNDWRESAQAIVDALEKGKRKTIVSNLQAEATGTDRDVRRLHELITNGTMDRVAGGEYPYENDFYPQAVHSALADLEDLVSEEFRTLSKARTLAADLGAALEQIRAGSGQPIPVPAPLDLGGDENPLLVNDAKAFAIFRTDPALVTAALQTKNPGGRANSFRITWNRDKPGEKINAKLLELRQELAGVSQVAARFRAGNRQIQGHPTGPAAAKRIYAQACDRLAASLPAEVRSAFDANRAAYEKGDVIVGMLETEEKILREGEATWEALGKALLLTFPD